MARKDIGKNTKKELDEDVIIDESGQGLNFLIFLIFFVKF